MNGTGRQAKNKPRPDFPIFRFSTTKQFSHTIFRQPALECYPVALRKIYVDVRAHKKLNPPAPTKTSKNHVVGNTQPAHKTHEA